MASVVLVYALGIGVVATALAVARRAPHTAARRLAARAAASSGRRTKAMVRLWGLFVAAYLVLGLSVA